MGGPPGPCASEGAGAQQCAPATRLAEDRADRVGAGAGDGAQPRDRRVVTGLRRCLHRLVTIGLVTIGPAGRVGGHGRGGGGREGADRGVEQVGDLGDPRGQLVELAQQHPGQLGVVVGEPAVQGLFQVGSAGAGPAFGQLGQCRGVALPGDQRLDHRPAGDPERVGEYRRDLDQGVLEQLLDPLLDPDTVDDQIEPGPGQVPHPAHRLGRHQRRRDHRALRQLGQPHRVDLVGLRPARDVLGLRGVDQPHRQPGRLQQVVERAPVVRGGLHHHPLHPLAAQVITQLDQRRGARPHRPHLGHPPPRDRRVRHPQTHHPAGLGHINRRDPFHDLLVLIDLHLDRLLHPLLLGRRFARRGCPRGPVGLAESDRRARGNSAQPFKRAPAPD